MRALVLESFGLATALDLRGDGNGDGYADLLAISADQLLSAWLFYGGGE